MKKFGLAAAVLLGGCATLPPALDSVLEPSGETAAGNANHPVGPLEATKGLKEALILGTKRAITRIGSVDGYWGNRDLHIPVPPSLKKVEEQLRSIGEGGTVDDFHLSLNRAAEAAVPEAMTTIANSIMAMKIANPIQTLEGARDAATRCLRESAYDEIAWRFRPVIRLATRRTGALRRYKDLAAKARQLAPETEMEDLDAYVSAQALDGFFKALAEEEARIRRFPEARNSALLDRVFGTS